MQTFAGWQQIICSDNDTTEPNVLNAMHAYRDPRVRYLTGPKRDNDKQGYGNLVRSFVLQEFSEPFDVVTILDDDKIYLPEFLSKMLAVIHSNDTPDVAVCRCMYFYGKPDTGYHSRVLLGTPFTLGNVDPVQVMVRSSAMRECGWDMEHGYESDGHTFNKLGTMAKVANIPDILSIHF
jgi:GT2 family glycosyltransferase